MTHLRMYAPMVVLLVWTAIVGVCGLDRIGATVALVTTAAAVKVQVDEARRQHAERRHVRGR